MSFDETLDLIADGLLFQNIIGAQQWLFSPKHLPVTHVWYEQGITYDFNHWRGSWTIASTIACNWGTAVHTQPLYRWNTVVYTFTSIVSWNTVVFTVYTHCIVGIPLCLHHYPYSSLIYTYLFRNVNTIRIQYRWININYISDHSAPLLGQATGLSIDSVLGRGRKFSKVPLQIEVLPLTLSPGAIVHVQQWSELTMDKKKHGCSP